MLISHAVQPYTGPLSKIRDKNPRMRKIFISKSPPKVHACADSGREFLTTDLKFPVHDVVQEQCNSYCFPPQYGFCASKHLPMGPRQAAWLLCIQAFAYGSTTSSLEFTLQGFAGSMQQNLKSEDPRPFLILVSRTIAWTTAVQLCHNNFLLGQ